MSGTLRNGRAMVPLPEPRRVVTGHDASGAGVVITEGRPPSTRTLANGTTFHEIWRTDSSPAVVTASEDEPIQGAEVLGPPACGTRVRICDLPPGSSSPMHRTESVDYGVVLVGEVTLVLDGGETRTVRLGDVVVQRGTDHAWENRTDQFARMLFVLVGGRFDPDLRACLPDKAVTHDVN